MEDLESEVKHILNQQKNERKALELSFLDAKQDLRRSECVVYLMSVLGEHFALTQQTMPACCGRLSRDTNKTIISC